MLNIFAKKMIVIANVFPKLQTVKTCVDHFLKCANFRTSFGSQHVKGSHRLVKYA